MDKKQQETTTKFTPGPWRIYANSDPSQIVILGNADGHSYGTEKDAWYICEINDVGMWDDIDAPPNERANAHLLAAAPDMYNALKVADMAIGQLAGVCNDPPSKLDEILFDISCTVELALRKAEGVEKKQQGAIEAPGPNAISINDTLSLDSLEELNVGELAVWMDERNCPSITIKIGHGDVTMMMAIGVGTEPEIEQALTALETVTDAVRIRMGNEK